MYYYIFDSFLNSPKYEKILDAISEKFVSLQITGEIGRVSSLKRIEDLVADALKKKCSTLVIIGNDETINKVINALINECIYQPSLPNIPQNELVNIPVLGIIPIGQQNLIASLLGISSETACQILSSRIIKTLDLGKANSSYFIHQAEIKKEKETLFEIDEKFKIKADIESAQIINLGNFSFDQKNNSNLKSFKTNPSDGKLDLLIKTKHSFENSKRIFSSYLQQIFSKTKKQAYLPIDKTCLPIDRHGLFDWLNKHRQEQSLFHFKKLMIKTLQPAHLFLDNRLIQKTPAIIEIKPKMLKIITGKKRNF